MAYITTVSGKHFDPLAPDPALLDIEDIAHALSRMCRANGHFRHFYSVAQHCIACAREAEARGVRAEVVLGCLLHDAAEAYICDLTRPVKASLPLYIQVEERLLDLIFETFIPTPLTEEDRREIFAIDDAMLSLEFLTLMPETLDDSYRQLQTSPDLSECLPSRTQKAYLALFAQLTQQLSSHDAEDIRAGEL